MSCLMACRQQTPKAYVTELDSNDSLSIVMGDSKMIDYHSERLGITVILRYDPRHAEAVEPLKELVRDYHL